MVFFKTAPSAVYYEELNDPYLAPENALGWNTNDALIR